MPPEGFLLGNPEHWFLFFAEPHALAFSSPWPSSPWTLFLQTGETRQGGLSLHLSHHLLGPSSSRQARPGKAGPCLLLSRALPQLSPSLSPPGHHRAFLATVARNIPLQFRPQNDFEIKFVLPLIVCRQPAEAEGTRSRNNGSSTTRSMRRSRTATGQGHPRAFLSTAPKQFQF